MLPRTSNAPSFPASDTHEIPATWARVTNLCAHPFVRRAGIAGAGFLLAVLLLAHLDATPRTWFDESSYLNVAKSLVQSGRYAERSSEGLRPFPAAVGVGPTVILPVAGAFQLGGIAILPARLVMVAYLLVALVAWVALMRRMASGRVALLATALLVASPGVAFVATGRQMLGEVPALAFLLCAFHLWFVRDEATGELVLAHRAGRLVAVGLFLGLVVVTKSQYGAFLAPALAVLAVLGWRWEPRLRPRGAILPLVVMVGVFAVWEVVLLGFVAGGSFAENVALLRQATGRGAFIIAPHRMASGARFLLGPDGYFALLGPALALATFRGWRRRLAPGEFAYTAILLSGFAWFLGTSIAWPRYAFIPLALSALPVARLCDMVVGGLWRRRDALRAFAPAATAALAVCVVVALGSQLRVTLATPDTAPDAMARYLRATLPADTVIETWEPELGFLTDHRYHFPPAVELDGAVRHRFLGAPAPPHADPSAAGAAYLIIGPFARYTDIYDEGAVSRRYPVVATVGDYTLYRVVG